MTKSSSNDKIEPTKDDLIAVAVKAGLDRKEAIAILEGMMKQIKKYTIINGGYSEWLASG